MASSAKRIDRRTVMRSLIVMAVFLLVAAVLIFALFRLQILEYDYYQKEVIDQLTHETEVNPERGIIYDRNGNILATNTTVCLIFISPQDIIDAMAEAEAAAVEAAADGKESESDFQTAYTWTSADGTVHNDVKMNELIARALQGDKEASERLVTENSGLIWSVAKRFVGRGTDMDDLYQLGCL